MTASMRLICDYLIIGLISMGSGARRCWCETKDKADYVIETKSVFFESITKLQAAYRGFIYRKKLFLKKKSAVNYKEIDLSFNTERFDLNPKIVKLRGLLPKFALEEKEVYMINTSGLRSGCFLYSDNSVYKGSANTKNQREGFGKLYLADGSIYEGFFVGNKMKGRGRLLNIEGYAYEGEFENSIPNGYGKYLALNGSIYEGNWRNNKQHGFGENSYEDGSSFKGDFVEGMKEGRGVFSFSDGSYYDGMFESNVIKGEGMYKWKDGRKSIGQWSNNKMNGYGIFTWPDKKKFYGKYIDNIKNGFGMFYWADGKVYEGFWKEGKQNGYGFILQNEERTYGEWYEGKQVKITFEENEIDFISNVLDKAKAEEDYVQFRHKIPHYENRLQLFQ